MESINYYTGTKAGFIAWVAERERESVMLSWFDKNEAIQAERDREFEALFNDGII